MTTSKNEPQDRYFSPGQRLFARPEWRRAASPRFTSARVAAPGRLHFTVFDFSKMAPGLGGGGLGISTATATNEVVVSIGGHEGGRQAPATVRHLQRLFQELVGYERDDISITVPARIEHSHGGFGSNVTLNTAAVAGLNAVFGCPFSVHEMWDMITQNFVENAEGDAKVYRGLDTGVGEACMLYGGLVWIDAGRGFGDGRYLGNAPAEGLWVVTAVGVVQKLLGEVLLALGREGAKGMGDKTEADVVAGICQEYFREFGPALTALLEDQLRPALLRNDVRGILKLGWELNKVGNIKVLEGIYRPDVLRDVTDAMRHAGALYAGVSSAGPGFFAFADSEADAQRLRSILEEKFGEYFHGFAVGRAGSKLSVDLQK